MNYKKRNLGSVVRKKLKCLKSRSENYKKLKIPIKLEERLKMTIKIAFDSHKCIIIKRRSFSDTNN